MKAKDDDRGALAVFQFIMEAEILRGGLNQ
jgi:hypothetical protein